MGYLIILKFNYSLWICQVVSQLGKVRVNIYLLWYQLWIAGVWGSSLSHKGASCGTVETSTGSEGLLSNITWLWPRLRGGAGRDQTQSSGFLNRFIEMLLQAAKISNFWKAAQPFSTMCVCLTLGPIPGHLQRPRGREVTSCHLGLSSVLHICSCAAQTNRTYLFAFWIFPTAAFLAHTWWKDYPHSGRVPISSSVLLKCLGKGMEYLINSHSLRSQRQMQRTNPASWWHLSGLHRSLHISMLAVTHRWY